MYEESKVYRVKVLMAFMKAGIPLEKLECQALRDLLQDNGYRLTDTRHMRITALCNQTRHALNFQLCLL